MLTVQNKLLFFVVKLFSIKLLQIAHDQIVQLISFF